METMPEAPVKKNEDLEDQPKIVERKHTIPPKANGKSQKRKRNAAVPERFRAEKNVNNIVVFRGADSENDTPTLEIIHPRDYLSEHKRGNLAVDEEDYRVVDDFLGWSRNKNGVAVIEEEARMCIGVRSKDVARRVYRLTLNDLLLKREIQSIPPSIISQLCNLEYLHLRSPNLEHLPNEIGDLISLRHLSVHWSKMKTIPSSIGRLRNLTALDFSHASSLEELPQEIGNLISLEKFVLHDTGIKCVPESIQNLKNLATLQITNAHQPSLLDKETMTVLKLTNLKKLSLYGSQILLSLEAFESMTNLMSAILVATQLPQCYRYRQKEFFLELTRRCKALGSINTMGFKLLWQDDEIIGSALARNRALFRTRSITSKLWPHVFSNPTHAYDGYFHDEFGCNEFKTKYSKPDAIFLFLRGMAFSDVIVDRNTRKLL